MFQSFFNLFQNLTIQPQSTNNFSIDKLISDLGTDKTNEQIQQMYSCKLYKCSNKFIVLSDGTTSSSIYTFYICESPTYLYCWKIKDDDSNKITTGFDLPGFYESTKHDESNKYSKYNKNNSITVFNTTNCFVFKKNYQVEFYIPEFDNSNCEEYKKIKFHHKELTSYINEKIMNKKIKYVTSGNDIMFILVGKKPIYIFCTTHINHKCNLIQEKIIDLTYILMINC